MEPDARACGRLCTCVRACVRVVCRCRIAVRPNAVLCRPCRRGPLGAALLYDIILLRTRSIFLLNEFCNIIIHSHTHTHNVIYRKYGRSSYCIIVIGTYAREGCVVFIYTVGRIPWRFARRKTNTGFTRTYIYI